MSLNINCNQISCNNNCKKSLQSSCVILSGECQDLCYVNFCNNTVTLENFIAGLCLDLQKIKIELDCMLQVCQPSCTINSTPITVSL